MASVGAWRIADVFRDSKTAFRVERGAFLPTYRRRRRDGNHVNALMSLFHSTTLR
jgi:hypothetical protein